MLGGPGQFRPSADRDLPCPRLPRPHERPALLRLVASRRSRRCCARWSSGSTTATPARRGSSRCPGRRGCPRRRGGPPPTARQRARARRWTGTRAVPRRSGTISRARKPRSVRKIVIPASGNRTGARSAGQLTGRGSPARAGTEHAARVRRHRRPPVQPTEESRRRATAAPATGCAPGASRRTTRPSSESPWRGGRSRSSTSAAMPSVIAHEQPPAVVADREPGGRRLDCGEEPELDDEAVVVRGELAVDPRRERVVASVRFSSSAADSRRHRSLSANHGNAQLAASCPAASAIRWLLADEPRLSNAARYSLVPANLAAAPGRCARTGPPTPGQLIQQPPDPGKVDQPDAELDAAGPVDAGQERVLRPP